MTILVADGFDDYATPTQIWTSVGPGAPTIVAAAARTGSQGLRCLGNTNPNSIQAVSLTLPSAAATLGVAFAFRLNGSPSPVTATAFMLALRESGADHVTIGFNVLQQLVVTRGGTVYILTAPKVIQAGVWYHLEIKATISDTVGAVELRLNGAVVTAGSGLDTRNGGTGVIDSIRMGPPQASANSTDYDDIVVWDTSGAQNNDFLGDVSVYTLRPTGAGATTAWTPSAGANYAAVDDPTYDDDATYVETSTVGATDTYAMADLPAAAGIVKAVCTRLWARKTDAGTRTVAPVLRHAGADNVGTGVNLANAYTTYPQVNELNPGTGVAWTAADVNAVEAGATLIA